MQIPQVFNLEKERCLGYSCFFFLSFIAVAPQGRMISFKKKKKRPSYSNVNKSVVTGVS